MEPTEIPCPWCGAQGGRIVLHGRREPWVVTEDGDEGKRGIGGCFIAGLKRVKFTTAPTPWFSCSSCSMTGTLPYLREVLAGTAGSGRTDAPGVHPGRLMV